MLHMRITMVHYGTLWRPMCSYVCLCVTSCAYALLCVPCSYYSTVVPVCEPELPSAGVPQPRGIPSVNLCEPHT